MYDYVEDEDDIFVDSDEDGDDSGDSLLSSFTLPAVHGEAIAKSLDELGVGATFRSLIERCKMVEQMLSDADPTLADLMSDIEATLRVALLEWRRDPAPLLLGVLSRMDSADELERIDELLSLLNQRRTFLISHHLVELGGHEND